MWVKCLFLALLTQCLALQQNCTQVGRKAKNLTIQLQVSQSSEFDFSGYIPAVELALSFINNSSCVLPDYHVSFTDVVDPQVSRKHVINAVSTCLTFCRHSCILHLLHYIKQLHTNTLLTGKRVLCFSNR